MKVVAGVVRPEEGEIRVDGEIVDISIAPHRPRAGYRDRLPGIVADPPTHGGTQPGAEPTCRDGRACFRSKAQRIAEETLAKLGQVHIDPRAPVSQLPLDQQQMVEIAKATMISPKILILDEATSSLGRAEVEKLFDLVRGLRDQGTTVVVITHRMQEVWALADSMTILRDGRTVGRFRVDEIGQRQAVSLMAGRDIRAIFRTNTRPDRTEVGAETEAAALELRDVRLHRDQEPWTLRVAPRGDPRARRAAWSGSTEFLHWIYGSGRGPGRSSAAAPAFESAARRRSSSTASPSSPRIEPSRASSDASRALEPRHGDARTEVSTGSHQAASREEIHDENDRQMAIKSDSPFGPVSSLSGGTQQKVVVGKFMATDPVVLLFVDSTRGIDVQTKFEFYDMLRELARSGAACVLYSSDTEELVGLCDRIAVFHDGVPVAMLEGDESLWTPSLRRPSPPDRRPRHDGVPEAPWPRGGCDAGRGSLGSRSYTAAVLVVVLLVAYLVESDGLSSIAALGITNAALPLALVAVAETFVILTNGIDLSVASVLLSERHACVVCQPRPRLDRHRARPGDRGRAGLAEWADRLLPADRAADRHARDDVHLPGLRPRHHAIPLGQVEDGSVPGGYTAGRPERSGAFPWR